MSLTLIKHYNKRVEKNITCAISLLGIQAFIFSIIYWHTLGIYFQHIFQYTKLPSPMKVSILFKIKISI